MSFAKVYIHFVWSTKNRVPFLLTKEIRLAVWKHIRENAKVKGIHVDFVSGYSDHCHCLVSMGVEHSMSQVMQLIKGESSFWINKSGLLANLPQELSNNPFEWQNDYYAVSVSQSILDRVRNYIKNQENHHKKKTYQKEFEDFIEKFGFERFSFGSC